MMEALQAQLDMLSHLHKPRYSYTILISKEPLMKEEL